MSSHQTETFRTGHGSDLRFGWQCFSCDAERADYTTFELAEAGEREHKGEGAEQNTGGGPIAQCPRCWAQVHSASMTAHEYWHEQLDDTAAIARGMEPGV
jgi:hypothetical protein